MMNVLKNALIACSFLLLAVQGFAQTDPKAMIALQTDNWNDALAYYEGELKNNASNQVFLMRLSSVYQALGQKEKALATLTKAFEANTESRLALAINGRQLLLGGNTAEAEKQFERADKKGRGKDGELVRMIGESYLYGKEKDMAKAESWLKNAYTVDSKNKETLMMLGYTYKNMTNKGGDAVLNYEYASALDPKNPLPLYLTSKIYWVGRNPAKYEEFLRKSIETDATFLPAQSDLADLLYHTRKIGEARTAYEKLIKSSAAPKIEDEMQLANCLFLLKDYPATITQVEKIISRDGSKNYLRRLLGYCYFEQGDKKKAKEVMADYFTKVTPDKIIADDYKYYGNILADEGNDSLALVNYDKAIKMDSSLWQLNGDIGKIHYKNKRYADAAKAFQLRVDSLKTEANATDLYYLGLSYYLVGDTSSYAKAEKAFTTVTERAPTAGIGWMWRAKTRAKSDPDIEADPSKLADFGKAKSDFEKFIEVTAGKPDANTKDLIKAYEYVAYYHFKKGDSTSAIGQLDKILAIEPTNQSAMDFKNSIMGVAPAPGGQK